MKNDDFVKIKQYGWTCYVTSMHAEEAKDSSLLELIQLSHVAIDPMGKMVKNGIVDVEKLIDYFLDMLYNVDVKENK